MGYPFRIVDPSANAALDDSGNNQLANYMDRLIKLVPAEVLGLYLTVRGFYAEDPGAAAAATTDGRLSFLDWWPAICVVLLVAFRIWGTRAQDGSVQSVQPMAIIVSVISFAIWVYAMGHTMLGFVLPDPKLAPTAVVIWVFVLPWFYKGSTQP